MNPISKEADPNLISKFTSLVNNNLSENGQLALDLVVNKLQSNKDWEILISLQV
jgi:hypothetical protein